MMDLEEDDWEYLPAAYHLLRPDHRHRDDAAALTIPVRSLPSVIHMDYFSTTDSLPQFLPLNFPPSPTLRADRVVQRLLHEQEDEAVNSPEAAAAAAAASNKVFFKNSFAKETIESVDMKFLDSSSSPTATSPRKIKKSAFDDLFSEDAISKSLTLIKSDDDIKHQSDGGINWIGEGIIGEDYVIEHDDDGDQGIFNGLNLWKLGFGGIGTICSFGVAAATICLILFGHNSNNAKQNHKLRIQLYTTADDQRTKQVVQQATKFNEAMSAAVRGVPLNRAHITYGGYYDSSL